jgi:hypothetical protein
MTARERPWSLFGLRATVAKPFARMDDFMRTPKRTKYGPILQDQARQKSEGSIPKEDGRKFVYTLPTPLK